MTLPEDTILENRYRIDSLLAHSERGAVYRAFDMNFNAPVAIKETFFQTREEIAQFKQEALLLARLQHTALPRVTHQFSTESQQYLVMEFIEGENLWEMVKKNKGPLEEAETLNSIIQVCEALKYLHRQTPPIIHRDIKPQNIMVTSNGQTVLVDFGIAKQVSEEVVSQYSSPEQYSGTGISPTSDIYALGATLYAILSGEEPPNSVSRLTGEAKLIPPDEINPKIKAKTAQAIVYAMQLKPADRPQSASHFQQIVETLTEATTTSQQQVMADTAVIQTTPHPTTKETSIATPTKPTTAITPKYWLVDSRGLGYPLGAEPLTIGSHPQVDVIIEDITVSPVHAHVRAEGPSCFIRDEETPQGTFLNGHRLRPVWYPFNQGDVLVIGPTRFYVTTTEPARLAPPKSMAVSNSQDRSVSASNSTSKPVTPPAMTKPRGIVRIILPILALVAVLVGIGVYLWFNPEILTSFSNTIANQSDSDSQQAPAPDQTQTAAAITIETLEAAVQSTTQAREAAQATSQAALTGTPSQVQENATVQASQISTPTPETIPIPTHTATATSPPIININTLAPTQAIATATPSRAPTRRVTPTISGPTLIPLNSRFSIERIGTQEVIDVDINPKNPREVYALVKRDGIYKSSNSGDGPWARVDLDGSSITALVIDPTDPTKLYAATWNAVLKSTDGGNSWDPKTDGLLANQVVDVIAIHPSNPELIYAGIGETLVVSTNGGESWTSQGYGAGLGIGRLHAIVIDPFDDNTVYVGGLAATLYKSTDSGKSFIPVVDTGKGAFSIAAHPSQRDVYLAGINSGDAGIIKTENNFEFESVSTGLIYGGADSAYSAIVYAPSNPNIVYAGSGYESNPDSKGIFKSSDGGESWESINGGLNINQDTGFPYYVKAIVVHPTNPKYRLCGYRVGSL